MSKSKELCVQRLSKTARAHRGWHSGAGESLQDNTEGGLVLETQARKSSDLMDQRPVA